MDNQQTTTCHTCIQCSYCDMWDMTCANIDNADKELNRMPICPERPACKHFTTEQNTNQQTTNEQ